MDTRNKWSITIGVLVLMGVVVAAGYIFTKKDAATIVVVGTGGSTRSIDDLNVTYELKPDTQKLYSIQVLSVAQAAAQNGTDQEVDLNNIFVSGKACNNMSGTIPLLPKGTETDKKVIKTLNDGRIVLEPQIASTMMACASTSPATDDNALNKVFSDIAESLKSF